MSDEGTLDGDFDFVLPLLSVTVSPGIVPGLSGFLKFDVLESYLSSSSIPTADPCRQPCHQPGWLTCFHRCQKWRQDQPCCLAS